jgi:hypothetical protein
MRLIMLNLTSQQLSNPEEENNLVELAEEDDSL